MAKTDVANRLIWFKGQIMNVNEAMVNVLSPSTQFGLNVFEGIPCYWNDEQRQLYAFRLSDHYDRVLMVRLPFLSLVRYASAVLPSPPPRAQCTDDYVRPGDG